MSKELFGEIRQEEMNEITRDMYERDEERAEDSAPPKRVTGQRVDNGEFIDGSLFYDSEQDCWRIATYFFDLEPPQLKNTFGVHAPEVHLESVAPILMDK